MGLPLEIGNFGTQASDYVLTLGAYDFFVVFVSAIEAFERRRRAACCAELQN